jgi:hypothetical protein
VKTNDGAAALIYWLRAVRRKGFGMAIGRQFVFLRAPFADSFQFKRGAGKLALALDDAECRWVSEADCVFVRNRVLVFEFSGGQARFYWPIDIALRPVFDSVQNLWITSPDGEVAAILDLKRDVPEQGAEFECDPVPRVVFFN